MDESHRVDNKYLNNHLGEIEDAIQSKLLSMEFVTWFLNQHKKYHYESGILNHDGFFSMDPYGIFGFDRKIFNILSLRDLAFIGTISKSIGPDLRELNTETTSTAGFNGQIRVTRMELGTVNDLYDEVAFKTADTPGNCRLGCYDDNAVSPDNLLAETAAIPVPTPSGQFNKQSVTEFSIPQTQTWGAVQVTDALLDIHLDVGAPSGDGKNKSFTFGAFQDPVTGLANDTLPLGFLLSHS